MWDLPGPGLEPVSPALAGGFLTTTPPVKSLSRGFFPVHLFPWAWTGPPGIMQLDPPGKVPQGGGLFCSAGPMSYGLLPILLLLCSYGHMVGVIQAPSKGSRAAQVRTKQKEARDKQVLTDPLDPLASFHRWEN